MRLPCQAQVVAHTHLTRCVSPPLRPPQSLRLNGTYLAARPSQLCFTVRAPCNTFSALQGQPSAAIPPYYMAEASDNKCCPTCQVQRTPSPREHTPHGCAA